VIEGSDTSACETSSWASLTSVSCVANAFSTLYGFSQVR
jgi:hypothetical protein